MLLLALKKFKFYALSPCHRPLVALGQKMVEMTLRETVGTICPREREEVIGARDVKYQQSKHSADIR